MNKTELVAAMAKETNLSKKDVEERIHNLNPNAKVFFVSAKTGEGFEQWTDWLKNELKIYSK